MAKRKRDVPMLFWMSQNEMEQLRAKLARSCCGNMSAYLRKMALDGYIVNLDLPELRELVSLLRYTSNNLNQLTRRVHQTGRIYDADLEEISQKQDAIWTGVGKILDALGGLS